MANAYNMSGNTNPNPLYYINKGNFLIGLTTGPVPLAPTSSTGFYNGITPPSNGYSLYEVKTVNPGPSIKIMSNDADLLTTMKQENSTGSTVAQVLAWAAQQTTLMVENFDYPSIVLDGILLSLDSGYVSSYPTTESVWYDNSVNQGGLNVQLYNSPTYMTYSSPSFTNTTSGSIRFTSASSQYGFNDNAFNILTPNYFSLECVFSAASTTTGTIVCLTTNNTATDPMVYSLRISSSALYAYINTNQAGSPVETALDPQVINTSNWYHVMLTYNGTNVKLYLNNSLVTSATTNGVLYDTGTPQFNVARRSGAAGNYFNGTVGILRVYNRALTASEVKTNYSSIYTRYNLSAP